MEANTTMLEDQATQDIDPEAVIQTTNLAENFTDALLTELGKDAKEGFEHDYLSREDWEEALDEWLKLAKQTKEERSFPWPNASNVKYPLLSTAAMQFAARSYPSLVPQNGEIVTSRTVGFDQNGQKNERATRVSKYMSYQILNEMDRWEEDMDKMLMMLPIVGTVFKKTWYDKHEDKIKSCLISPKNLVVNYWAKNLDEAERVSEIIEMSQRVYEEKVASGHFLDVDLGQPTTPKQAENAPVDDKTTPYTFIEQHTWYQIKANEGMYYPVVVTFERESGKVVRCVQRYETNDIVLDEKGKAIRIKPTQYYTKFGFIPNPDGSFYDIGFGVLLGPLNESVNTLINQLVDAGSLSNLQSGFIGKALKIRSGDQRFQPGEWKPVNATGDDLRKQIVPLPAKEPSNVLFQLMGTLITSGKELASVAEIFTGKMPGQNTPATTTMATVEQGMKVFTAVYKRLYRALSEEFLKIYKLNSRYLDPNKYITVIDTTVGPEDFDLESCDIIPGADPSASTQTEKMQKAQGLLELLQMAGPIMNPIEVVKRVLEAQQQPNWQMLFSQEVLATGQIPPPPPDPKLMAMQAKMQADQQKTALDAQSKMMDMEFKSRSNEQQLAMEAQKHAQDMQFEQQRTMNKAASEIAMARVYEATSQAKGQQDLNNKQQAHDQKMAQTKESASLSQKSSSKSGKPTQSPKRSSAK